MHRAFQIRVSLSSLRNKLANSSKEVYRSTRVISANRKVLFMDEQNLGSGATPEMQQPAMSQRTFTQDDVNALIGKEKQMAAARARQEVEREYQQRAEQAQMQQQQMQAQNPEEPRGPSQADADAMYQQVQERFNRDMQERQFENDMTNMVQSYHAKMGHARQSYSDFDEVTKQFDPTQFPQLTFYISQMENAGDIIYDLSQNPNKIATLDLLAQRSPQLAQAELHKLSQSIAHNSNARNEAEGNTSLAPLNPLQPSRVSGSNGKMTVNDLRNQPWLRG